MIHDNSAKAFHEHDAETRNKLVVRVLTERRAPMTDREICTALGSPDMNYARPAITALKQKGMVEEVGNIKCPVTGAKVRVVSLCDPLNPPVLPVTKADVRGLWMDGRIGANDMIANSMVERYLGLSQ